MSSAFSFWGARHFCDTAGEIKKVSNLIVQSTNLGHFGIAQGELVEGAEVPLIFSGKQRCAGAGGEQLTNKVIRKNKSNPALAASQSRRASLRPNQGPRSETGPSECINFYC